MAVNITKMKMPFYAVARGRNEGIYTSWPDCKEQVFGYSNAKFRKFYTFEEAHEYLHDETDDFFCNCCGREIDDGFTRDDEGYVEVYTDGACLSNGQYGARAGIGVFWGDNHPLNVSEPVKGRATNNCGEIQAATRAIEIALENDIDKLAIHTDAKFLINAATRWMPGWIKYGWKLRSGEPVKNSREFKELNNVMHQLDINWVYVGSHCGIHGNEMADHLARKGAQMYRN